MSHRCHVETCRAPCPPRHLTCAACWKLVPPALQREVYDTVGKRVGGRPDATWAPWWRAQAKAIDAVLRAGVVSGRWVEAAPQCFAKKLATDMLFADYIEGKLTAAEHNARRAAL